MVVIDSDIDDTDEAKGEPDVTVNGKILRMVQAVDGNWYGYFADRNMASIADATNLSNSGGVGFGDGLDFGTLCLTGDQTNAAIGFSVADTVGIAMPFNTVAGVNGGGGQNGTAAGGALTEQCGGAVAASINGTINVVREAKDPNTTLSGKSTNGQIGLNSTIAAEADGSNNNDFAPRMAFHTIV